MQKQYESILTALHTSKDPRELIDATRTANMIEKPQHVLSGVVADEADPGYESRCWIGQVF
mgnify:CR=1 FL=1